MLKQSIKSKGKIMKKKVKGSNQRDVNKDNPNKEVKQSRLETLALEIVKYAVHNLTLCIYQSSNGFKSLMKLNDMSGKYFYYSRLDIHSVSDQVDPNLNVIGSAITGLNGNVTFVKETKDEIATLMGYDGSEIPAKAVEVQKPTLVKSE
jgi:hypothetical protein